MCFFGERKIYIVCRKEIAKSKEIFTPIPLSAFFVVFLEEYFLESIPPMQGNNASKTKCYCELKRIRKL